MPPAETSTRHDSRSGRDIEEKFYVAGDVILEKVGGEQDGDLVTVFKVKLGAHLRTVRKQKKLTQAQLAGTAKVTAATVSRIEKGTRGDPNTCARLLATMGAPAPEISVGEPDRAVVRAYAKVMSRIGVAAFDRLLIEQLDREHVLGRLSDQLSKAKIFRSVVFWLIDQEGMRAVQTPGNRTISLTAPEPVAEAFHTGQVQVYFDEEGLYGVPIRRGHRVLAVAQIAMRDPDDDAELRIEAAEGLFQELALLLLLSQEKSAGS
jgi:transcriptional regulator with XRE-family HTH domain